MTLKVKLDNIAIEVLPSIIVRYRDLDGNEYEDDITLSVAPHIELFREADDPDWLRAGIMIGLFEDESEVFPADAIYSRHLDKEVVMGEAVRAFREALETACVRDFQPYIHFAPMVRDAMKKLRHELLGRHA